MSVDECRDKADVVHIYTIEYHSVMKRREALTLATTWMDPENTTLSVRSRHRTHRV